MYVSQIVIFTCHEYYDISEDNDDVLIVKYSCEEMHIPYIFQHQQSVDYCKYQIYAYILTSSIVFMNIYTKCIYFRLELDCVN